MVNQLALIVGNVFDWTGFGFPEVLNVIETVKIIQNLKSLNW